MRALVAAETPRPGLDVELDRCVDQLLTTGGWEIRLRPGMERAELESLMRVAALLRALSQFIARPRPSQKDRIWMSVSNSFRRPWSAAVVRHRGRSGRTCARPHFGSV